MKKYIRKVTRVGKRSLSIIIPADIVDELKIRERQKLTIHRSGKKIIIEDWKKITKHTDRVLIPDWNDSSQVLEGE